MTQPELHPDADTLNAFAEQSLPDAERARIVAHMAGCGRCREIVYLARAAAEPEMAPTPAKPEPGVGRLSAGFAKWRVALIPAAALASVGVIVLWMQLHPAPTGVEMAKLARQSIPSATESVSRGPDQTAQPAARASKEPATAARPAVAVPNQSERIAGHEGKKAATAAAGAGAMDQEATTAEGSAASPIHLDARSAALARYAPPPEPISPPPPVLTFTPPQSGLPSQKDQRANPALETSGKRPVTVAATPSPGVVPAPPPPNALAVHGGLARPAAGGPAELAVQSQPTLAQPTLELAPQSPNGFAMMRLARRTKLPSGLSAVSSAALLNRLIAVDSAGAVFLSQDGGQHWEPVKAQWTGKAVAVQAPPQHPHQLLSASGSESSDLTALYPKPQESSEEAESANAVPAQAPAAVSIAPTTGKPTATETALPVPNLLFRLVTDHHKVWVSVDGKAWREQ